MQLTFELEGGNFSKAGYASSQIKKILKQLSIDSRVIKRVVVALYEAEVNVVAHAWRGKVAAELDADKITLTLKDEGPGIPDIPQAMQEGFSTASPAVREMGRNGIAQYEKECRRINYRERGRRRNNRTHGYLVQEEGVEDHGRY